jgi:hypothetical protein
MREIRPYGSEGGAGFNPVPTPIGKHIPARAPVGSALGGRGTHFLLHGYGSEDLHKTVCRSGTTSS